MVNGDRTDLEMRCRLGSSSPQYNQWGQQKWLCNSRCLRVRLPAIQHLKNTMRHRNLDVEYIFHGTENRGASSSRPYMFSKDFRLSGMVSEALITPLHASVSLGLLFLTSGEFQLRPCTLSIAQHIRRLESFLLFFFSNTYLIPPLPIFFSRVPHFFYIRRTQSHRRTHSIPL